MELGTRGVVVRHPEEQSDEGSSERSERMKVDPSPGAKRPLTLDFYPDSAGWRNVLGLHSAFGFVQDDKETKQPNSS